jgi:hypothetical protein
MIEPINYRDYSQKIDNAKIVYRVSTEAASHMRN